MSIASQGRQEAFSNKPIPDFRWMRRPQTDTLAPLSLSYLILGVSQQEHETHRRDLLEHPNSSLSFSPRGIRSEVTKHRRVALVRNISAVRRKRLPQRAF